MDLDVSGHTITDQQVDYTVSFLTSGGFEFRVEGAFTMRDATGEQAEANAEDELDTRIAAVGTLTGTTLTTASVADDGTLRVSLQDGRVLTAGADEQFEAWTIAGPEGLKIVCLPGGELAVWSATATEPGPA